MPVSSEPCSPAWGQSRSASKHQGSWLCTHTVMLRLEMSDLLDTDRWAVMCIGQGGTWIGAHMEHSVQFTESA